MAVSESVKAFSGPFSGPASTFPMGFPAENYSQISVWRYNDAEQLREELSYEDGDYSAQFSPSDNMGQVTIEDERGVNTPGDYFIFASRFPEEQGTVFSQYGRFDPVIHEKAMDKIVMQLKQLRRDLDRVFTPTNDPQGEVVINADTINISGMEWLDYLIQAQAEARNSADEAIDAKNKAEWALTEFQSQYLGEFYDAGEFPVDPRSGSLLFYHGGAFGPIGLYTFFGPGYVDPDTGTPWVLAARKGDQGSQGVKGDRGTDALQFEWLGNLMDYPQDPQYLQFFRHIVDKKTYLYTKDDTWEVISSDGNKGDMGVKGDKGDSLRWRGAFNGTEPNDPQELDLYRDTAARQTFFYDGSQWVLWVSDGDKGDKGDRGDSLTIDATGDFANRFLYDNEDAGFSYFAFDYEIQPSSAPREDVFAYDPSGQYQLSFAPKGEQSVYVTVNNIIQSSRAYSFTVVGGDYVLSIVTSPGDEIVVREFDLASGVGALFIKKPGVGQWSDAIPFGQGPQGIQGLPGKDGRDGDTGPIGKTLVWKGTLADEPSDPEDFWAYRDSVNNTLLFYFDGEWHVWAKDGDKGRDGVDGLNATEIVWAGSLASAPASPAMHTVYKDTTLKTLRFWDGVQWNTWAVDGTNGTNGTNGSPARNFFWRGALSAAPTEAAPGRGGSMELDLYRNTVDGNVYCRINGVWEVWAQKGDTGTPGAPGNNATEPPSNASGTDKLYVRKAKHTDGGFEWTELSDAPKASKTVYGTAKIYEEGGTLYIVTT